MLCPLDVVGQLVALQGDNSPEVRLEALRLIQIEDEKHPTFLDNRLLDGVESAYHFQISIMGKTQPVDDVTSNNGENMKGMGTIISTTSLNDVSSVGGVESVKTSIFGALYTTCIQPNKRRRNEFLIGLLRRALIITETLRNRKSTVTGNSSTVTSTGGVVGDNVSTLHKMVRTPTTQVQYIHP